MIRRERPSGLPNDAIVSDGWTVSPDVMLFPRVDRASDADLVTGMSVNDDQAIVAFVRRFERAVFGLAISITHDRGLAEDVSQEAFLRAWRAAGSYDQRRGAVITWLLTITRNLAIDMIRARRVTPIEDGVLDQLVAATRGSATDAMGVHLEAVEAARQLRRLPPDQARAVILAVIGGNTAQEVADHEKIPLGTAKTRIRTGLLRMRLAMEVDEQ